jgi:hypothetical protein
LFLERKLQGSKSDRHVDFVKPKGISEYYSGMGVGRGANNPTLSKRKMLRNLQEIQPDFVEEARA